MQKAKFILLHYILLLLSLPVTGQYSLTDSLQAESFFTKAGEWQYTNADSAIIVLKNAKTFCLQHNLYNQLVESFNRTGAVYTSRNNLSAAIGEYEEAIQICKSRNLNRMEGITFMNLATLYEYMGNYRKAAENYLPTVELLKSNDERKKVLGLYRNILSVISNLQQQNLSLQNIMPFITDEKTNESDIVQLLTQRNTDRIFTGFPDQALVREIDKWQVYVIFGGAKFPITSFEILGQFTKVYRNIQKIPSGSLAGIPDIPEDGTLIMDDRKKIFLIKGRKRHWIKAYEVLNFFGGYDAVCQIPSGTLEQVPDAGDSVTISNMLTKFNFKRDYQFLTDSLKIVLQKNKTLSATVGRGLKEKNNALQRHRVWLWTSFIGFIAVIVVLSLLFSFYRQKQKLHEQTLLALKAEEKLNSHLAVEQERTRIAADMHDDLGAGLSTLRFLAEKVGGYTSSDLTKRDISKMEFISTELIENMNEIIWAMNEKNDSLEDLLFYCRHYAVSYCEDNQLSCSVLLPDSIKKMPLSGEWRRNIFLVLKESLHNIIKHADGKNVSIVVTTGERLEMMIRDDGKGIEETRKSNYGNGLRNMQKRMESMNGRFRYFNENGLQVVFSIPLA